MPFERYLQPQQPQQQQSLPPPPPPPIHHHHPHPHPHHQQPVHTLAHDPADYAHDSATFSSNVQFQLPHLMFGPSLAPGGGAEVLPAGILGNASALASPWFTNLGFPRHRSDSSATPADFPSHSLPPFFNAPHYPYQKSHYDSLKALPLSAYPAYNHSITSHSPLGSPTPPISTPLPLPAPSALGLPVYSASGFDLLSVLARVVTRPNPKIVLGPVDMTCSFVVTDKRRFDNPVVYVSPSFTKLTGYDEQDIIGTNCRFLQAPHGKVQKGDHRKYTSSEAVNHLRTALAADKECQTSMINYRKGGAAFINLITVIPIPGGVNNTPEQADDYVYHVGFQVDLTEQPNAILNKLRDGTYIVNYSSQNILSPAVNLGAMPPVTRDWRNSAASMSGVSKEFRSLLTDSAFVKSLSLHTATTTLAATSDKTSDPYDGNKLLNLLLLQSTPDFLHVVSLKGAFLYVAPTVKRVLGWEPEDLVGRSITEFCHPADIVPLMRELKESSSASSHSSMTTAQPIAPSTTAAPAPAPNASEASSSPKVVDLLFRIQFKVSSHSDPRTHNYVWLECRGRMHIEPGKGRKAIILSGRVRSMPALTWQDVPRMLLATSAPLSYDPHLEGSVEADDVWALLSTNGTFLFVGTAVRDVLGWGAGQVIGKPIMELLTGANPQNVGTARESLRRTLAAQAGSGSRAEIECEMCRKDGSVVRVRIIIFGSRGSGGYDEDADLNVMGASTIQAGDVIPGSANCPQPPPRPLICLIRLASAPPYQQPYSHPYLRTTSSVSPPTAASIFDELDPQKSTSWQYELQQLKYANQRLQEEVHELQERLNSSSTVNAASRESISDASTANEDAGMRSRRSPFNPLKRSWDASQEERN